MSADKQNQNKTNVNLSFEDVTAMSTHQQNPDGTWSPADPVPFAPGIDWEVYGSAGEQQTAVAYDGATELAHITGRGLWFRLKVWRTHRRLTRTATGR